VINMNITKFIKQCERVLKIANKPTKEEYMTGIKITTIGILLIGTIGFLIYLIFNIFGVV